MTSPDKAVPTGSCGTHGLVRPDGSAITSTWPPGLFVHPDPTPEAALEPAGYQVARE